MTQQTSPFLEAKYGWDLGESNWNLGMDENLLKFSFMFDRNVDGIVASLPAASSGASYFLTTDNRLYFAAGTLWYSTPTPKWLIFTIRTTGMTWQFNGTAAVQIDSPAQTDSRLDAVELTVTNFVADLANQVNPAKGADLVGYKGRTVADVFSEKVNIKDFGAVCDGVTNDSAAVQAAVNYCATFSDWPALIIPGPTRLATTVVIDRMVDTTESEFRIIGEGNNAGFTATTSLEMFTTSIPFTTDPKSEHVAFENLNFVSPNNTLDIYTLGAGFLRIRFDSCFWQLSRSVNSDTLYAQDYRFTNCKARGWQNEFFVGKGAFAIKVMGSVFEFGALGFYLIDSTGNTGDVGCSFHGNLFEGCTGEFVQATTILGMEISGNYFELNTAGSFGFDFGFTNRGISFSGNLFASTTTNKANAAFFEVRLGPSTSVSSNGNYCDGRLYDTTLVTGSGLETWGDSATLEIWKGNKTSLLDSSRTAAVGVVSGRDPSGFLYTATSQKWVGFDNTFNGMAVGPGVIQDGAYVPIRFIFASQNPQTNNAFYGNPFWTIGSRISNDTPAVGQPKGWICTVSGQPGTWVSEGNL